MNNTYFLKYYKLCPSGIVLLGILTSLIPLNIGFSYLWLPLFAFAIGGAIIFLISYKAAINYFLWCMIGFIALEANLALSRPNEEVVLQRGIYGEIKFSATDNSLTAEPISWLREPKDVYISVSAFKESEREKWINLSGKFYMKNSAGIKLVYGRSYEGQGTIMPAETVLSKSFSNYLKSIGVFYVFYPETIKELDGEITLRSRLTMPVIKFRDHVLERCVTGIENVPIKEFLAGILFGFRQGLDYETRNQFLETGTIHIIAISGSHIGILALVFLFLLKPFPIRLRYLLVPLVLLIYIIAIGYLHSAVRAFIMVSIFFIFKASLRVSNPFNILFFTCSLMLIVNPYSLLNPGFLFSYVIVLFLLLGWKVTSELKKCSVEKGFWIPKKRIGHSIELKRKLSENIALGISSTLIAALASVPLQLLFNGLFTPIVPVVSILVLPLMFPLFFVCIVKAVFFGLIPSTVTLNLINIALEGLVSSIFDIVRMGYDLGLSFYLIQPHALIIVVFYLALLVLLLAFRNRIISLLMVLILSVITLLITALPQFYKDKVIFLESPGSENNIIIIVNNSQSSATVINSPVNSAFEIQNMLRKEGINRIDNLILFGADKNISGGALNLIKAYKNDIEKISMDGTRRNTKMIARIEKLCAESRVPIELFYLKGNPPEVVFFDSGKKIVLNKNREGSINLEIDGKEILVKKIEDSSEGRSVFKEL